MFPTGIVAASINGRVKSLESLQRKVVSKRYSDLATQVTDLVGARVILYTEAELTAVCGAIAKAFRVHSDKSGNKSDLLGTDRFGYRSVHYTCDLGEERTRLPENAVYRGLVFEIQIRTILQHAWAEIEHDRNYKMPIPGGLPPAIKRRLALVAGLLESADRELSAIAVEVDAYAAADKERHDLAAQIERTIERCAADAGYSLEPTFHTPSSTRDDVLQELALMGVTTEHQLVELVSTVGFWEQMEESEPDSNWLGVARNAMMYQDLERYFATAWKEHWMETSAVTIHFLSNKYGGLRRVRSLLNERGIFFNDEDSDDSDSDYDPVNDDSDL